MEILLDILEARYQKYRVELDNLYKSSTDISHKIQYHKRAIFLLDGSITRIRADMDDARAELMAQDAIVPADNKFVIRGGVRCGKRWLRF
jgi:hypothetical protein